MNDLRGIWRKVDEAVETMATGLGPIDQRLWMAWVSHLASLEPGDFPQDLRDRFAALQKAVGANGQPLPGEQPDLQRGLVWSRLTAIGDEVRVQQLAEDLVAIAGRLRILVEDDLREQGRAQHERDVADAAQAAATPKLPPPGRSSPLPPLQG